MHGRHGLRAVVGGFDRPHRLLSDGSGVASLAAAEWRAAEVGGVEGPDGGAGRVVHADAARASASAGAMDTGSASLA
ncbi:hypothetical protein GCM10010216_19750 [Streptomyces flaveolus]|nr:hypothetical protein GCM10010216_19750 [Streptomyces flaveolus]